MQKDAVGLLAERHQMQIQTVSHVFSALVYDECFN